MERKLNALLLQLKEKGSILAGLYHHIRSSGGLTRLFYDLLKVQKPGVPLHSIVSFYSSPSNQLSKHLSMIFAPILSHMSTIQLNLHPSLSHRLWIRMRLGSIWCGLPLHQCPSQPGHWCCPAETPTPWHPRIVKPTEVFLSWSASYNFAVMQHIWPSVDRFSRKPMELQWDLLCLCLSTLSWRM